MTEDNKQTTALIGACFHKQLSAIAPDFRISLHYQAPTLDGTSVYLIATKARLPVGVLLLSSSKSPEMVARTMLRAKHAKATLSNEEASRIPTPIFEGLFKKQSVAVLPYYSPFSEFRPIRWLQRKYIQQKLFDWLYEINRQSVKPLLKKSQLDVILSQLTQLVEEKNLSTRAREIAQNAKSRLIEGYWTPFYVLCHGDLWDGNILLGSKTGSYISRIKRDFMVIDWPTSSTEGFGIFDLVVLSKSMNLSRSKLNAEITRHCKILKSEPIDSYSYLMAAIGQTYSELEFFEIERFSKMVDDSVAEIDRALGRNNLAFAQR